MECREPARLCPTKTGLDYLHSDKDKEAVKLISRFRIHNNRVKFEED